MKEKRTKHPYFIYETIMNTPEILSSWFEDANTKRIDSIAEQMVRFKPNNLFLSGTGSSYMASLAQSFVFNEIVKIPATAYVRSELMTYMPINFDKRSILFLNTHSGKSPGDEELIKIAKDRGLYTIGVSDNPDSPFAKTADSLLIGNDGIKKEMPATRTYSSAMFRVILLAISCARKLGFSKVADEYEEKARDIPVLMKKFLNEFESPIKQIARDLHEQSSFFIISSGPNMSTAYEGAMGLTQGTGLPTAGYNVDEYLHGPVQALSKEKCIISVAPQSPMQKRMGNFSKVARNIGAKTVMIAPSDSDVLHDAEINIPMPAGIPEIFTPVLYCAPFWLLGYYFSILNEFDPDTLSMEKENFKNSGLQELKKAIY